MHRILIALISATAAASPALADRPNGNGRGHTCHPVHGCDFRGGPPAHSNGLGPVNNPARTGLHPSEIRGERLDPGRIVFVDRTDYGLPPLPEGYRYARLDDRIYRIDERTLVIDSLVRILDALN